MRQITITLFICGMLISIMLAACTGTKIKDTKVDESFRGKPVSNILVIGVTYKDNEKVRRSFEDRFVAQFQAVGVEAISSGDAISIPEDLMLKKDDVLNAINKFNNDAVLITNVVGVEEKETFNRISPSRGSYYGYYEQTYSYVHSPVYNSTNTLYRVKTNLYDVKTKKLIWSGISETLNPDSKKQMINDVIEVVIKDLQKKDLIPKK